MAEERKGVTRQDAIEMVKTIYSWWESLHEESEAYAELYGEDNTTSNHLSEAVSHLIEAEKEIKRAFAIHKETFEL